MLSPTLGDEREGIIADVNAGRVFLWESVEPAAFVILAVAPATRELCVCCVAGCGLADITQHLATVAKQHGLRRIRYYSERGPAIKRLLCDWPIREAGRVYYIELEALH